MTETSRRTDRPARVQEPHAATESSGCSSPRGALVRENTSALVLVFIHFSKLLHLPLHGGGGLSFSQGGRCGESGRKLCSKRQQLLHSWSAPSYGQGSQWHSAWVEETSAKPRQKRFQKVSSCWRYTKMLAPKTMVPQCRGPLLS